MTTDGRHLIVHCYSSTPRFKHPSKTIFTPLRWQVLRVLHLILWSLLLSNCRGDDNTDAVTGATSAFNGYDHLTEAKPICWQGMTPINTTDNRTPSTVNPFDNTNNKNNNSITPLLLPSCPKGTQITASLSQRERKLDALPDGTWMGITNAIYEFDIQGSIDLSHWNASNSSLWNGNLQIDVSMVLCSFKKIRFCTPFLHYETSQATNTRGTLHGTSHVDTIVKQVSLIGSNFSASVSLKVDEPGAFSVVVGAFFVYSTDDSTATSHPIFHAAQLSNVASDYPVIAFWDVKVSRPARLAAYILVASSAGTILFLLLSVLRHRKSRVLKLTQRNLLVAMLATALIATIFSVTFEPRNSLYCNLQGPLVIFPLHVLFSILLGRLWRIQAILSPMLLITLEREKTWSDRFVEWLRLATELPQRPNTGRDNAHHHSFKSVLNFIRSSLQSVWKRTSTINQPRPTSSTTRAIHFKICERQVARVVAIFCFPQILVQVLYLIFSKQRLVNGVCPSSFLESSVNGFGGVLLLLLVLLLLALARSSKDLPTLFNENEALWDVALVSLVLLGVGFVVTIITRSPTTKPDIRYIVSTLTVVAITTNASLKLVVPKLRKIWMKEIVVVTKLISDHNRMERTPLPGFFGENTLREMEDEVGQRQQGSTFTSSNPPSLHDNGNINVPTDVTDRDGRGSGKEGHESDDSSVVFIHHEEAEQAIAYDYQSEAEGSGAEPKWSMDSLQCLPACDTGSDRVQNYRTDESLPQNISFGLPTRSNLLAESFSSIPENAVPMTLIDRFPSAVGSIPTSEASPSQHEVSRMNFSRGPHGSIVKNRSRWSFRRLDVSQDSNNSTTSGAPTHNGNGASASRPNNKGQLLDIGYNPRRRKRSIRIVAGNAEEPAPRRLLLRMIHVHHKLGSVNRSILLGNQVSREDWELLREEVVALGRVFEHEVRFEWETPYDESDRLDEPALLAAQSAPLRRGSYSKKRQILQPSSLSRLMGDDGKVDLFSTSAAPDPGASDHASKDRSAGGRVISGMLNHIPRPRAGKASLARASTDPSANVNHQLHLNPTSLGRSVSGGDDAAVGVSTTSSPGARHGHLGPSSRERFAGGGKKISGLWHHIPRPRSRDGTPTRATTVPGPLQGHPASTQSASHIVVPDDDSESKKEEEEGDDDCSLDEVPSTTLPSRTRELLRPGRPFRRSRFRSSGLSSSLQTIHSVSDSVTSGHDSGMIASGHDSGLVASGHDSGLVASRHDSGLVASGHDSGSISCGVFVSFDNNLPPNSPVSSSGLDATADPTVPLPQPGPPTAQVSSLSNDNDWNTGNGDQL